MLLKKLGWWMLSDPIFVTLIDTAILKVLEVTVVRVVLKGHRWMEHLYHLARLWKRLVWLPVLVL
jgi:hypothetical protein